MSRPDLIFNYAIVIQICLLIWLNYNTKLKRVLFHSVLNYFQQTSPKNSFPDLLDTEIVFPDSILCA